MSVRIDWDNWNAVPKKIKGEMDKIEEEEKAPDAFDTLFNIIHIYLLPRKWLFYSNWFPWLVFLVVKEKQ